MSEIDPRKVFYRAMKIGGTIALGDEESSYSRDFISQGDAVAFASGITEAHGGEYVIHQCTPIKRVFRPKTAIEPIEGATTQRKRRERKAPAEKSGGGGNHAVNIEGGPSVHVSDELPDFLRRNPAQTERAR